MGDIETKITGWLLKIQKRQEARDEGCGYVSCRAIAEAMKIDKRDMRPILESMAERGLIIKSDCTNGMFWRSTNKVSWEIPKPPRIELPKNFVVQRETGSGGRYFWFDDEAFETKDRAYSHMNREVSRQQSAAMHNCDRSVQNMRVIELTRRANPLSAA